jgi:hypothetical protein
VLSKCILPILYSLTDPIHNLKLAGLILIQSPFLFNTPYPHFNLSVRIAQALHIDSLTAIHYRKRLCDASQLVEII